MKKQQSSWARLTLIVGGLCLGSLLLSELGCNNSTSRSRHTTGERQSRSSDSTFLADTLSQGFNNLAREVVLELTPPQPILDDSKSADRQPVLATVGRTPGVQDGPFNYLSVPKKNGNFRSLGVRRGDKVRYFVLVDQDSVEHGIEQVDYLELTVRRLDTDNQENALIVEAGLNGPVEFPHRIEIWRFSDERMLEINQRLARYWKEPKTLISWEPSPDESALTQLLERANQWLRNHKAPENTWQAEPLVGDLADEVRKPIAGLFSAKSMQAGPFSLTDVRQIQQAIWTRDIAKWAKHEALSPLEVAQALFDWTVRNIQLDASDKPSIVHQPWQALMYGHGTAEQRAWVFAELCRQQQLDVVMLATSDKWWLPALLHDGQLYLFDTRFGLPIPGKEPNSVATLANIVDDPALLAKLDVGEDLKYATTAEDLQQLTAWIVASPLQLSKRASLLEQALEGDDYVVLSAASQRLTQSLKEKSQVKKVGLWPLPFQSIRAEREMPEALRHRALQRFFVFASKPRLWKARVLHFQGTKDIPVEQRNDPLAQPDYGHRQATALYQHPNIRPPNVYIKQMEPNIRAISRVAKGDASYWLGLLSYDLGNYQVAKNWLAELTLAASPDGPWTPSARYNLARTLEALADFSGAIQLLEADDSPQRHGNLLRARQLKTKLEEAE